MMTERLTGKEWITGVKNLNNGKECCVPERFMEKRAFWFTVDLPDGEHYNSIYWFSYDYFNGWDAFYEYIIEDLAEIIGDVKARIDVLALNKEDVEWVKSLNKRFAGNEFSDGTWGWTRSE